MDYSWFPSYRDAILETDKEKMPARLLVAEQQMVARLRVLSQDHGGTAEERQAIADALNGIKSVRSEIAGWKRNSSADVA